MSKEIINEIDAVRVGIDILSKSSNAQDLCRRLTLSEVMNGVCQGVAVYLLDPRSMLVEVARFGKTYEMQDESVTAWDDNLVSRSVRSKKLMIERKGEASFCALPIQHDGVTTGAFVFAVSTPVPIDLFPDEITSMLSSLGGLFMESKSLSFRNTASAATNASDASSNSLNELTSRQITIIQLIADGLTNADIAKRVLLSESTVRQETIRIFRTLKCHSRSEAVVKARAAGIIEAITPPPPQGRTSSLART